MTALTTFLNLRWRPGSPPSGSLPWSSRPPRRTGTSKAWGTPRLYSPGRDRQPGGKRGGQPGQERQATIWLDYMLCPHLKHLYCGACRRQQDTGAAVQVSPLYTNQAVSERVNSVLQTAGRLVPPSQPANVWPRQCQLGSQAPTG